MICILTKSLVLVMDDLFSSQNILARLSHQMTKQVTTSNILQCMFSFLFSINGSLHLCNFYNPSYSFAFHHEYIRGFLLQFHILRTKVIVSLSLKYMCQTFTSCRLLLFKLSTVSIAFLIINQMNINILGGALICQYLILNT
jgi:hypothetical protein